MNTPKLVTPSDGFVATQVPGANQTLRRMIVETDALLRELQLAFPHGLEHVFGPGGTTDKTNPADETVLHHLFQANRSLMAARELFGMGE